MVSSASADQPAPRSRKGVQTRARLIEAAREVFERDGFLNARISDIAATASLSQGSFYHYFESKEQIFREVAEAQERRLTEPDGEAGEAREELSPREVIGRANRRYFERYLDAARLMGVIEQVSRFDQDVSVTRNARHHHYHEEMADSIRRLQRHGLVDPDLDPEVTAAALGSMTYRFPELWFVQGLFDCDFDEGVEQFTRVFVRALGLEDDAARSGEAPAASAKVAPARRS